MIAKDIKKINILGYKNNIKTNNINISKKKYNDNSSLFIDSKSIPENQVSSDNLNNLNQKITLKDVIQNNKKSKKNLEKLIIEKKIYQITINKTLPNPKRDDNHESLIQKSNDNLTKKYIISSTETKNINNIQNNNSKDNQLINHKKNNFKNKEQKYIMNNKDTNVSNNDSKVSNSDSKVINNESTNQIDYLETSKKKNHDIKNDNNISNNYSGGKNIKKKSDLFKINNSSFKKSRVIKIDIENKKSKQKNNLQKKKILQNINNAKSDQVKKILVRNNLVKTNSKAPPALLKKILSDSLEIGINLK